MPDPETAVQPSQAPIFTSNVPVPLIIELTGNLANNWKHWKPVWSAYEQSDEYRVAAFITCIGPKAPAIHNGLPFENNEEKKSLDKILELWESYCLGKTNYLRALPFQQQESRNKGIDRHIRIQFEIAGRQAQFRIAQR